MDIKKNDMLTVTIDDIGNEGEGIGKAEGYTLFVKDAVVGDVVEVKVMKAKKNYGYAKLEKVVTPSPFRVQPKCRFYKQCGGCQIQALEYKRQLEFKQNRVKNNLIRIGKFEEVYIDSAMDEIIGMEEPYYYRNKAQFPIGTDKEGNLITGFYAGHSHDIIPNTSCCIGSPENERILNKLLTFMTANGVSAYDEESGKGLVRHILIRVAHKTREIMVCLVLNGKTLPKQDLLIKSFSSIPKMTSISISINTQKTNVIMGKEIQTIWGKDYITDYIGEIQFRISPLSFYQVNSVQAEKLYGLALEYAGLTGEETVWDLYCGIGTISLFLSQKAKKVYGVEMVPQAIEDAGNNAKINGIKNVEFLIGRAEVVLPEKYETEKVQANVIVVDPPRKGCDAACLEVMIKMKPERIVYVSCDSATLARDLAVLCEGGYGLEKVRCVDQFCQTTHVEVVIQMTYCGDKAKNKD